jgi:hypothetical protein
MLAKYNKMSWGEKALLGGTVALIGVLAWKQKKQEVRALENCGGFCGSEFSGPGHSSGRDFDYPVPVEGAMAKNYLAQLEQDARSLRLLLRDQDNLPGWVNFYIATSSDRLQQASRYMQNKIRGV